MSLSVTTPNPESLLAAIKKEIDDGKIDTWEYDSDGDFTHSPPQWRRKAWLHPRIEHGALAFGLLGQTNTVMSKTVYGVYHGRFIEMLLNHFDNRFSVAEATAMPTSIDSFSTASLVQS